MTALTDALQVSGIPVGVGGKPADVGTRGYGVIWPDVSSRAPSTMRVDSAYVETWVCHCYGLTEQSARMAADALTDAVYRLWRTQVDGRTVQYPEQLTTRPLSVDRDATPDLFDYVIEWRFRTTAA